MRLKVVWLLAMMAAALPLQAGEQPYVTRGAITREGRAWVQFLTCQVPTREGGRLTLRVDEGSLRVQPGASSQVGCVVRLAVYGRDEEAAKAILGRYQLSARNLPGRGVTLSGRFPYEERRSFSVVGFSIQTPARYNLDLETQGGGIDVSRLDGELVATTAGGDIRAGDITGPVRVKTAGGCIDLGNVGQRVEAQTAGGHIRVGDVNGDVTLSTSGGDIVAGMVRGFLRAETAGGSIYLRAASGPVQAQTAGGQIQLGECGNTVEAQTAAGSIRVDGARGLVRAQTAGGSLDLLRLQGAVEAETAAGRIMAQFAGNRDSFAASQLQSTVGDVLVYLPANLPLTIDADIDQSTGHRIFSDFPLSIQGSDENYGGSVRARGTILGGGQLLRLRTNMGNIEIKKLDEKALNQFKAYERAFWLRWQAQWNEHAVAPPAPPEPPGPPNDH